MARNQRKTYIKKKWLFAGLAALVVIGVGFNFRNHKNSNTSSSATSNQSSKNKIDYSPGTKADNAANEARKGSTTDSSSTLNSSTAPQNTGSFSVTINRAGLDSSKQNLQIATLINGVNSGTCTAKVSQTGQNTITQTEDISLQVNNYVCPVMNIPASQFPNKDKWNVSMTVESNGKSVTSNWAANPVSLSN